MKLRAGKAPLSWLHFLASAAVAWNHPLTCPCPHCQDRTDRRARRERRGGCTRRDCQSCKTGWPADGEPLSDSETRRWVGIWQAYESDAVAAEPVYPHRRRGGER